MYRSNVLILRVDPALSDRLKAQAWALGVPVSVLVRAVLTTYLDACPAENLLDFVAAGCPGDRRPRRNTEAA